MSAHPAKPAAMNAKRSPQPHAAVIEAGRAHALHRDRFGQRHDRVCRHDEYQAEQQDCPEAGAHGEHERGVASSASSTIVRRWLAMIR